MHGEGARVPDEVEDGGCVWALDGGGRGGGLRVCGREEPGCDARGCCVAVEGAVEGGEEGVYGTIEGGEGERRGAVGEEEGVDEGAVL